MMFLAEYFLNTKFIQLLQVQEGMQQFDFFNF